MSIPCITLIEDNEGDVMLIKQALNGCGASYDLKVFNYGDDALAYFKTLNKSNHSSWPDLIMLDYNLPKTHGLDVLQYLKREPELRVLPVVIYSSSEYHKDILEAYKAYVNSYIIKPGNMDDFCRSIETIWHYWFRIVRLPTSRNFK